MPGQFDVHRNPGPSSRAIPFVVVVQSSRFRASAQRVVVPLVDVGMSRIAESDVSPRFVVEERMVALDPLRITNVPARLLGDAITSLADHESGIMNALDTMLSRAWR